MPSLKRRSFLQLLGAAGLTPFLPALPAKAVVASGGTSVSKALWAGIYANSGSPSKFAAVAKSMGLTNTAIQGVSARSIGVRVSLSALSEKVASAGTRTASAPLTPQSEALNPKRKIRQALKTLFTDEIDETPTRENHGEENDGFENVSEKSRSETS